MSKEETKNCGDYVRNLKPHIHHHGTSNPIYGLGVIGALFYFLQGAVGYQAIIIGIGKAIFWPAVVIFRVLSDLGL